jgi:hypothetical protein
MNISASLQHLITKAKQAAAETVIRKLHLRKWEISISMIGSMANDTKVLFKDTLKV